MNILTVFGNFVKITQSGGERNKLNNSFFKLLFLFAFLNIISFVSFGSNVIGDVNKVTGRLVFRAIGENAVIEEVDVLETLRSADVMKKSINTIIIVEGVTGIGDDAFGRFEKLKRVIIEDGSKIQSMGKGAFNNCESLTDIEIPSGIKKISSSTFFGCINLTNIVIPNGVELIDTTAFFECYKLKTITIPSSVGRICTWAFNGCDSLQDVFYNGTGEQWKGIILSDDQENKKSLGRATIHCTDVEGLGFDIGLGNRNKLYMQRRVYSEEGKE